MLTQRLSGVLFHISSLPGSTGIGTFGKSAYDFVDFLSKSKQSYWQVLPLGPTGFGDSPYQSFSTFAGNPYFIDFEILTKEGFLDESDWKEIDWGDDDEKVDFGKIYVGRKKVFEKLQENFERKMPADFASFCEKNNYWLSDYALFMAIKDANGGSAFSTWSDDIRLRKPDAIQRYSEKEAKRIQYYKILQYFFQKQWAALKSYANKKNIEIIGDIPIYVSPDSSDVWSNPKLFDLDKNLKPREVSGCPPDAFTADGQLWGNPVYDWRYSKRTNYKWWKSRMKKAMETYDIVRIDHFRGFDSYYCIPFGAVNARNGVWRKGPGMSLFRALKKKFRNLPVIAEDLGYLTDSVRKLLSDSTFPGMKILQFAFPISFDGENEYLPYNYPKNSVVYTGTHDNDTIFGWLEFLKKSEDGEKTLLQLDDYFDIDAENADIKEISIRNLMLREIEKSASNTAIICMQDLLGLGSEARMNAPSTCGSNWQWRATKEQLSELSTEFLAKCVEIYGRERK